MVINSTAGFQAVYEQMEKLKAAARKSGLFIVSDSDLAFNQPTVRVKVDRNKAQDLGITMQNIGGGLAVLAAGAAGCVQAATTNVALSNTPDQAWQLRNWRGTRETPSRHRCRRSTLRDE